MTFYLARMMKTNQCSESAFRSVGSVCFGASGSASGSFSQRYGSEDSDLHPHPYQNFTDPQHCKYQISKFRLTSQLVLSYYTTIFLFLTVRSLELKIEVVRVCRMSM
jgi:hypothetical protein